MKLPFSRSTPGEAGHELSASRDRKRSGIRSRFAVLSSWYLRNFWLIPLLLLPVALLLLASPSGRHDLGRAFNMPRTAERGQNEADATSPVAQWEALREGPFMKVRTANTTAGQREVYFQDALRVVYKFPEESWLRQAWLKEVCNGVLMRTLPQRARGPENSGSSTITAETALLAVRVANEGERAQPDNAFFPWLEAIFRLELGQQREALGCLERAGQCRRYDDGVLDKMRAHLRWREAGGYFAPEDKLAVAAGQLFPHLAKIRTSGEQLLDGARLQLKQGNKREAVRIAAIVARAGHAMTLDEATYINSLVGQAVQTAAWVSILYPERANYLPPSVPGPGPREDKTSFLAASFQKQMDAVKMGSPLDAAVALEPLKSKKPLMQDFWSRMEDWNPLGRWISVWYAIYPDILWLGLTGLGMALAGTLWSRAAGPASASFLPARADRRLLGIALLATLCLMGAAIGGLFNSTREMDFLFTPVNSWQTPNHILVRAIIGAFWVVPLLLLPPVTEQTEVKPAEQPEAKAHSFGGLALWFRPLTGLLITVAVLAACLPDGDNQAYLLGGLAFGLICWFVVQAAGSRQLWSRVRWGVAAVALCCATLFTNAEGSPLSLRWIFWGIAGAAAITALLSSARGATAHLSYAWRLKYLGSSLLTLCLLGYVMASTLAVQSRARMDEVATLFMTRGDLALAREWVARAPGAPGATRQQ